MSCAVALAVSLLLSDPNVALAVTQPPVASAADAPASVAGEPLFADIILRAGALRSVVRQWSANLASTPDWYMGRAELERFTVEATDLAALDMQGHLILKERGTDGDLKCILRGIAEDMPLKVEAVRTAAAAVARRVALDELVYLLNDNVEVITAPPQPPA